MSIAAASSMIISDGEQVIQSITAGGNTAQVELIEMHLLVLYLNLDGDMYWDLTF